MMYQNFYDCICLKGMPWSWCHHLGRLADILLKRTCLQLYIGLQLNPERLCQHAGVAGRFSQLCWDTSLEVLKW